MPAWFPLKVPAAGLGLLLLAGCFVSDGPLIPPEQAVLPIDGRITLCPEEEPCFEMLAAGDGYATPAEAAEEDQAFARFAPLAQIDGRQVFVMEVHTQDSPEPIYAVARRVADPQPGDASIDYVLVDCSDLDEIQVAALEAAGGERISGYVVRCKVPSLAVLRATFLSVYGPSLGDDAWWDARGEAQE